MRLEAELDDALHSSQDDVMMVFRKIYEKYCRLIFFYIRKSVESKEDCEDLTNDVFLGFFNGINNFDTSKSLKVYLIGCANKRISDYYAKRKDSISYDDSILISKDYDRLDHMYTLMLDEFKNIINELEMKVIVYHVLYDFTFKEIAIVMKVSINTIKSAYKRGIKKLRDYYEMKEK